MTLQQLKYAMVIAENGSMNIAAKKLFITQPTLSKAIKELERELDIEIFYRTNRGIQVTIEGIEFLGYAKQVLEESELLEQRYLKQYKKRQRFAITTQHYAFAVSAFVNLVQRFGEEDYELILRETKTYEILDDVKNLRSEIGILYINAFNRKVLEKFFHEFHLVFTELFTAKPHVFISDKNPLATKSIVKIKDLEEYPYLSFEQGEYNSFHFSEEILSTLSHKKSITVSDRATLFNLLIGINGYTISTGVLNEDLNGNEIISIPLEIDEEMTIGYVVHKDTKRSCLANIYIDALKQELSLDID